MIEKLANQTPVRIQKKILGLAVTPDLLLAGIIGIGAVLRWFHSDQRGFIYDDAFSYFLAARPLKEIVAGTAADTMPPLYYFLLHFWMRLGQQVWVLRSLNILISLATVFLLYRLVGSIAGPSAARWAALLAAVSPFQIYHAQDIRMYALLAFGQVGYIACFWMLFYDTKGRSQKRYWGGLVLFGTLAMYSHNLAVILLVTADLILIIQRRWKDLARLILGQAGIVVLFIPWLLYLPGQIAKVQHAFWTPRPGVVEIIQSIVYFHSNWPLVSPWLVGLTILLSLQIMVLAGIELARLIKKEPNLWVPLLLVAFPPAILFLLSYLMRPVFVTRSFITSALVYEGLLGIVIAAGKARFVRVFVGVAALVSALGGLPDLYGYAEFPRSPFQQADAYLRNVASAGGAIIHDNKLSYFPAHFFDPGLEQQFIADEPGSSNDTLALASQDALGIHPQANIMAAAADNPLVYFVVFQRTIQEYQDSGVADHPALAWLKQNYRLTEQRNFNDLEIYRFSK